MAKSQSPAKQNDPKGSPEVAPVAEVKTTFTQFVMDLASLMYMQTIMAREVKWADLSSTDKAQWCSHAESALTSLDKLNKEVVAKRDIKKEEYQHNKNIDILKTIIANFVAEIKALKCPECGKTRAIRMGLFPSEELANKILNCELK